MKNAPINILSTRKIDAELKRLALKKGVKIADFDFLEYIFLDTKEIAITLIENKNPLVFTSQYAVDAIVVLLNKYNISLINKTCFAIHGTTAKLAAINGFEVLDTANNSNLLAAKIVDFNPKKVLFCCGNIRLRLLPEILANNNILIDEMEVYQKTLIPFKITEKIDGILFFSPSQIDAFLVENKIDKTTTAFCIGNTTAEHLKAKQHFNCVIANEQSVKSVIESAINYYALH